MREDVDITQTTATEAELDEIDAYLAEQCARLAARPWWIKVLDEVFFVGAHIVVIVAALLWGLVVLMVVLG